MLAKIFSFLTENVIVVGLALAGLFTIRSVVIRERKHNKAVKKIDQAKKQKLDEPLSLHPEVNLASCSGCGACTLACPEGDILQMINHKAVLVSPSKCVGHGACEAACPTEAISLVFGTKRRGMEIPRISADFETNVSGLYIAGELGGMGLIRNAVKQGAAAARHALRTLPKVETDYDLLIVGAGPAGLSASLAAVEARKKYLCIEQNSLGGTIAHFPRQKVVMSYALDLPIVGKKRFSTDKISKEELLRFFADIKAKINLQIQSNTKFEGLTKERSHFKVKTSSGEITTKKVILAMGVRGSPRKLGVPGEETDKVTYNLIEPDQYQERKVIVVGGGNAGVEAAQMLGQSRWKNKVHLLIRGTNFDRCNEENINIITKMEASGLVEIWRESSITEIFKDRVKILKKGENIELSNDFVFVFAGAEMPHKFLMSLGIQIDKKFGEKLSS